jgi:4-cresol dehydrogenase (hydroxylating)
MVQTRSLAILSFHFAFPEDDDLEEAIELSRSMKLSNFVPTLFRLSNDIYLCGSDEQVYHGFGGESPEYRLNAGKRSISDEGPRALRIKHGVG